MDKDNKSHTLHGNSVLAAIRTAGIEDDVFRRIEAGETLVNIQKYLEERGIESSLPSLSKMRAKHLPAWQESQVRQYAQDEFGVTDADFREVVTKILLAKFGHQAKACRDADLLMRLMSTWAEQMRVHIQLRADNRAERDSVRKFAMKVEDLLADEEKLTKLRAVRAGSVAAGDGTERRIDKIMAALWQPWDEIQAA